MAEIQRPKKLFTSLTFINVWTSLFFILSLNVFSAVFWWFLVDEVSSSVVYGGLQVQNKSQLWKQNNKLQTQMQI